MRKSLCIDFDVRFRNSNARVSCFIGDFELFWNYQTTFFIGIVVYNIINIFFARNLFRRFGLSKSTRKDFYECGFRPQMQKPIQVPIQFILIAVFFIIYDIELIFLFPMSTVLFLFDLWFFFISFFFIIIFVLSLWIDYGRHALSWQI